MKYFFAEDDVQKGPFPLEGLRSAGLKPDSLVWREGMADWQRADTLDELASVLGTQPAPAPYDVAPAPFGPGPIDAAPAPAYPAATYPTADAPAYPPAGSMGLGYQQPGYYGTGVAPPAGMAIAAMVLGIVSLPMMCLDGIGTPCAIIAIVLGHIARRRAFRGEGGGAGMALAGMICGYISVGILALGIIGIIIAVSAGAFHR